MKKNKVFSLLIFINIVLILSIIIFSCSKSDTLENKAFYLHALNENNGKIEKSNKFIFKFKKNNNFDLYLENKKGEFVNASGIYSNDKNFITIKLNKSQTKYISRKLIFEPSLGAKNELLFNSALTFNRDKKVIFSQDSIMFSRVGDLLKDDLESFDGFYEISENEKNNKNNFIISNVLKMDDNRFYIKDKKIYVKNDKNDNNYGTQIAFIEIKEDFVLVKETDTFGNFKGNSFQLYSTLSYLKDFSDKFNIISSTQEHKYDKSKLNKGIRVFSKFFYKEN